MNNIQKAFKNKAKCGLRMAVGGSLPLPGGGNDMTRTDQMAAAASEMEQTRLAGEQAFRDRMAPPPVAPAASPLPAGTQPKGLGGALATGEALAGLSNTDRYKLLNPTNAAYKPTDFGGVAPGSGAEASAIGGTNDILRSLRGGMGMAEGGIVRGKGGPTDDEVPMAVGGTDVNLSPREAVLPVKTVMALGGPAAVEQLIEETNGKPPVKAGLRAGGNYGVGTGGLTAEQAQAKTIAERVWKTHPNNPSGMTVTELTPEAIEAAPAPREIPTPRGTPGVRPSLPPVDLGAIPSDMEAPKAPVGLGKAVRNAAASLDTPGGVGNTNVGEIIGKGAAKVVNNPVTRGAAKAVGWGAKKLPYVGAAVDAADVVDVFTDPNKTGMDRAHEVANKAGKWGAAGLAAIPGAAKGAALGTAILPGVGTAIGGFLGGAATGGAAYYGAGKLMDAAGGPAPSESANGVVSQALSGLRGEADPVRAAHDRVMNGNSRGTIPGLVTPEQKQAQLAANAAAQPPAKPLEGDALRADIQQRSNEAEGLRSFAQRSMNLPAGDDAMQRGKTGLRAIAGDAGIQNSLNTAHEVQGTGIKYSTVKGADGKPQVMISGGVPTKPQYIGTDGKGTNSWYDTAQYAESQQQGARDRQSLKNMQWDNAVSSLQSPSTSYQNQGLRAVQSMLAKDEIDAKGQMTPYQAEMLASQRRGHEIQLAGLRDQSLNRAADNKRLDDVEKRATDEVASKEIEAYAKQAGDDAPALEAKVRQYVYSNFKPEKGQDSRNWAQEGLAHFKLEQALNETANRWLTSEKEWDGMTNTQWEYDPSSTAGDGLRNVWGSHRFRNEHTRQVLDLGDITRLPPEMQLAFLGGTDKDGKKIKGKVVSGGKPVDMSHLIAQR